MLWKCFVRNLFSILFVFGMCSSETSSLFLLHSCIKSLVPNWNPELSYQFPQTALMFQSESLRVYMVTSPIRNTGYPGPNQDYGGLSWSTSKIGLLQKISLSFFFFFFFYLVRCFSDQDLSPIVGLLYSHYFFRFTKIKQRIAGSRNYIPFIPPSSDSNATTAI